MHRCARRWWLSIASRHDGTQLPARVLNRSSRSHLSRPPMPEPAERLRRGPYSAVKLAIFGHHVITKPPLRPDAPPPHTSASTRQTSTPGSRRLIIKAVHRPTNPPPTMAMSQLTTPRKGFGSSAALASACSSQNERCRGTPRGRRMWARSRHSRRFHDHIGTVG